MEVRGAFGNSIRIIQQPIMQPLTDLTGRLRVTFRSIESLSVNWWLYTNHKNYTIRFCIKRSECSEKTFWNPRDLFTTSWSSPTDRRRRSSSPGHWFPYRTSIDHHHGTHRKNWNELFFKRLQGKKNILWCIRSRWIFILMMKPEDGGRGARRCALNWTGFIQWLIQHDYMSW